MIKSKKCIVDGCINPNFSKGFCKYHRKNKKVKYSRPQTKLIRKDIKSLRDAYFEFHIKKCFRSEESNTAISVPSRFNICHIFPKETHPSVGADIRNCIYYTAKEHSEFDRMLFKFDFDGLESNFPNSWSTVIGRITNLLPDVKENTIFKYKLIRYINEFKNK